MRLTLPREKYEGDAAGAFFDQLSERLTALPGVRAVAASSQFPPAGPFSTRFRLETAPNQSETLPTVAHHRRHAVVFPDARRAAQVRTRLLFCRSPRRTAGDRRQRSLRRPPSFRRRAARPAGRARQRESSHRVGHDRRRRRRLSQQRTDAAGAARDLHARAAADGMESVVHVDPRGLRRPPLSCRRSGRRSPRWIPISLCTTSRLWTTRSLRRRSRSGFRRCWSRSSPASRWCWPRSASTASCRTRSARAHRRSGSVSRSARSGETWSGWSSDRS